MCFVAYFNGLFGWGRGIVGSVCWCSYGQVSECVRIFVPQTQSVKIKTKLPISGGDQTNVHWLKSSSVSQQFARSMDLLKKQSLIMPMSVWNPYCADKFRQKSFIHWWGFLTKELHTENYIRNHFRLVRMVINTDLHNFEVLQIWIFQNSIEICGTKIYMHWVILFCLSVWDFTLDFSFFLIILGIDNWYGVVIIILCFFFDKMCISCWSFWNIEILWLDRTERVIEREREIDKTNCNLLENRYVIFNKNEKI